MYNVIKDNEIICQINQPCYVHYIPLLKSWNVCEEEQSQAIWVVPYEEEHDPENPKPSWYARLDIHTIDEDNKDFPLVQLEEVK